MIISITTSFSLSPNKKTHHHHLASSNHKQHETKLNLHPKHIQTKSNISTIIFIVYHSWLKLYTNSTKKII